MSTHKKVLGAHDKIRALVVQNEQNVNVVYPDARVEIFENINQVSVYLRGKWVNITPEDYNEIYTRWKGGDNSDGDLQRTDDAKNQEPANSQGTEVTDASGTTEPAVDGDGNSEPPATDGSATEGSADGAASGDAGTGDAGQSESAAA